MVGSTRGGVLGDGSPLGVEVGVEVGDEVGSGSGLGESGGSGSSPSASGTVSVALGLAPGVVGSSVESSGEVADADGDGLDSGVPDPRGSTEDDPFVLDVPASIVGPPATVVVSGSSPSAAYTPPATSAGAITAAAIRTAR